MAIQLAVELRVVDTDSDSVLVQAMQASTLTVDTNESGEQPASDTLALARSRMRTITAEVENDLDAQLSVAEDNARRQGV